MVDRVISIDVDPSRANTQLKGLTRNMRAVERASERVDKQNTILGASYSKLAGVIAGVGIGQLTRNIVSTASELQQINARLSRSTNDLAGTQEFLRQTTRDLNTEYTATADAYSRILPLQKGGLVTLENARKITIGLANVQAALGVSTNETALSLRGLVQAMGSGNRVKAEEFNQVFETAPALLQEVGAAAGFAAGEFRRLVLDGQVDADTFVNLYVAGLQRFDGAAAAMSGNVAQSFNRVKAEYQLVAEQLSAPITSSIVPLADSISGALRNIAQNSDEYVAALKAVAVATALVYGSRAASEIVSFGRKQVAAADRTIAIERDKARAFQVASAQNAQFDAQRAASAAAELSAEANTARALAASNTVRATAARVKQEDALITAGLLTIKREEILAETQVAAAVANTTRIEAVANAAKLEQRALGATTNAVRLKFAQQLEVAALAESEATAALTKAIQAETAAKRGVSSASALEEGQSRRLVQAKINETKARSAEVVAVKAAGVAYGQSNAAKLAAVGATNTLTAAENAAAIGSGRLTLALRAQAISASAAAVAARGLAAAYSLVGGGVGVAVIAGFAIFKLATFQTQAEKTTNKLREATEQLNEEYGKSSTLADGYTKNLIAQARAEILATSSRIKNLQSQEGFFASIQNAGLIPALQAGLEEVKRELAELEVSDKLTSDLKIVTGELDAIGQLADRTSDSLGSIGDGDGNDRQSILDKILPDKAKERQLEQLQIQLDELYEGDVDDTSYKAASAALSAQLRDVKGLTAAEEERSAAIDKARDSLGDLANTYQTERERIQQQLVSGNEIINLNVEIDPTFTEGQAEQVRVRLKERINEQLRELDQRDIEERRKAQETLQRQRDEANAIQIQRETTNREALRAAQAVIDPAGEAERAFRAEQDILKAQADFNIISQQDLQTRSIASLIQHRASVADIESQQSQTILDAAIASGATRESAEQEHQDRLASISRLGTDISILREQLTLGEIARGEFHARVEAAEQAHQERLAGITATNAEISLATKIANFEQEFNTELEFGSALLDLFNSRNEQRSRKELESARNLDDLADEAEERARRSGTNENQELARQARDRANIAEQAARDQFDRTKRANLVQARIAQGLAVVNAYATGGNFFTGAALAATAFLKTQQVIDDIRSQSFNGGSRVSSPSTGGSDGGTGSGSSDNNGNQQPAENAVPQVTFVLLGGPEYVNEDEQQRLAAQRIRNLSETGVIGQNEDMSFNFENVPAGNVRRVAL